METSSKLKIWLQKITGHLPVSIYKDLFKRDTIAYFYHVISDGSLPHIKHLYAYKSPEMFEHDLVYLLDNYTFVSYEQIVAHANGNFQLKPNSVFLSFDDGYRECFTVVRPLLLKYGVPCTFFVTTDTIDNQKMDYHPKVSLCIEKVKSSEEAWRRAAFTRLNLSFSRSIKTEQDFIEWIKSIQHADQAAIDTVCETLELDTAGYLKARKPFMSIDELQVLDSDGFTIGAHSKSHRLLEGLSADAIELEMVESCQIIQEITRAESIPFAFPYHGNGLKWSLLEDIRSRNKVVGYLFDTDGIRHHKGSILGRIWADAPETDGNGGSNLPRLLYLAYQEIVFDWFRKYKPDLSTIEN